MRNGISTNIKFGITHRPKTWRRLFLFFYSGAPAARSTKRSPILIWETKGNPWVDFFMVIMASGIARGRLRTTTTTTTVEPRKMAAILQILGWQRHAALVYCVLLWYWTSMSWSIDTCQNKVSADQYHETISQAQVYSSSRSSVFWSWPLTKCWFFDWIAGSCLLKTGQDCSEAG